MSRIVTKIITVLFGFDIERQKARLKISPQPNQTKLNLTDRLSHYDNSIFLRNGNTVH